MRKKVVWIITLSLVTVMAVAAIVGVIYGVSTHDEPERLFVCWHNEAAVYFDTADEPTLCDPIQLRWGRAPLTVVPVGNRITPTGPPPEAEPWQVLETWRAIDEINTQVGRELLVRYKDQGMVDIVVVWGAPREHARDPAESCRHYQASGSDLVDFAEVMVYSTGDQALAFRVLLHGLGHALTLAHDHDNVRSIMHPTTPGLSLVEQPAWLTDTDRELLRAEGP